MLRVFDSSLGSAARGANGVVLVFVKRGEGLPWEKCLERGPVYGWEVCEREISVRRRRRARGSGCRRAG